MLSFYLDENLPVVIAEQLRRRGITVTTVRDLEQLGDADRNHLQRATEMGYVLCTYDADFLRLANEGIEHTGIVFGKPNQHWVGEWVKGLALFSAILDPEDMRNQIEYL